ncbi:type II toxin-antitoxin system Phd/YefM family antitoxin [Leptolyngbya sp. AN03gr2]|uniref:type II toxin-antitoxin system Phd/YefM family antitoxin n=1 Tax=unclassified Leptolyngbya TaxID=2650499 RepID=UPI003D310A62
MKEVTVSEVQSNFSEYLQLAEQEEILITRDGKPVGLLVGFEEDENLEDYRLESDSRFLRRIAKSRESVKAGNVVRLEDIDWDSP